MKLTKQVTLIMNLNPPEQFKFHTPTGPIMVNTLRFSPEDFSPEPTRYHRHRHGWARGSAIKKDGSIALFDRQGNIPFSDIPPHLLEAAIKEFNRNPKVSL